MSKYPKKSSTFEISPDFQDSDWDNKSEERSRQQEESYVWPAISCVVFTFISSYATWYFFPTWSSNHDAASQKLQAERFENVFRWFGADVDKQIRVHARTMEQINQAKPSLELPQLPEFEVPHLNQGK